MELNHKNIENILFEYVEQIRLIISPENWGNILLDCSKNELLVLLLLYRKDESNMSQIAEYLNVPLNTATGIITRMENKKMVLRNRYPEDKRVVAISLTDIGKQQMSEIIQNFVFYGKQLMTDLTQDEMKLLMSVLDKVINVLREVKLQDTQEMSKTVRKIIIE